MSSLPKPILPPQGTHVARAGFGRGRMGLLVWQPQKTKQNLGTDKTHHPPTILIYYCCRRGRMMGFVPATDRHTAAVRVPTYVASVAVASPPQEVMGSQATAAFRRTGALAHVHGATRWLLRRLVTLLSAVTLLFTSAAVPTVVRSLGVRVPVPALVGIHASAAVSDDLSAAVRVHRGERSIDVWLVTPLSQHWDPTIAVPGVADQLDALGWPPVGSPVAESPRVQRLIVSRASRVPANADVPSFRPGDSPRA